MPSKFNSAPDIHYPFALNGAVNNLTLMHLKVARV